MNILIIGKKSKLGKEFEKLFKKLGFFYFSTDIEVLDMSDKKSMKDFFSAENNFTHIINCAAYNNVDKAEIENEECFKVNKNAPIIIAEYAKKMGAVFVAYSTDFVFDGEKKDPYIEEDNVNPLSIYGKSKSEMETEVLKKYKKSFVIRTSWLFGEGGENFNTQVINWSKDNNILKIVDDQISAPTYAKDLAYFSWKLIQTEKYGLYHITNNGEASKYEQAEYLLNKLKWNGKLKRAKTEEFNLSAKRPEYSKLSSIKIEKLLNEKIPEWKDAIDRFLIEIENK